MGTFKSDLRLCMQRLGRRRAERLVQERPTALRAGEEKFRHLAENAPGMIYRMSLPDGRYEYVSPASTGLLGYSPEKLLNTPLLIQEIIHPDSQVYFEKQWSMLLAGEMPPAYEYLIIHGESGKARWLHQHNTLIRDETGSPVAIEGIVTDVTEHKQVEEELRESEEKFRALYENAPLAYQSLDGEGCFLDVNPAWLKTLGHKQEDVIGKRFSDFLHPDWKPHFEKNFPAFKKRGYVSDVQFKIRHKDGHYLDISFEGCIGLHPDGSFRQTYCVFQDVTARKRAEDELRVERDKLETIFESIGDGIYIVNRECDIEYVNPLLVSEFGPYEGRKCYSYFHERDEACPWCKNSEVFAGKTVQWEWTLPSNGKTYDLLDTPLVNADGSVSKLEILRDITDRKQEARVVARFNRVLEESLNEIFIFDAQTLRFVEVNRGARDNIGYSIEELRGMTPLDIKPEMTSKSFAELMEPLRAGTEEKIQFNTVHRRKDGTQYPVEIHLQLVDDDAVFVAIIIDISKRIRGEEKIKQQQYYLEKAQELGQIGSWGLDLVQNKLYWTDENCRIFGVPDKTVATYEIFIGMVHPDDREYVEREWTTATQGKPYDIEHRIVVNNATRWVREKADVTFDDDGIAISAIGFTQDITKRKEAEIDLAEHRDHLEERVGKRTEELHKLVDLMAGRENRMAELKQVIKKLRAQLDEEGITPVADDPIKE